MNLRDYEGAAGDVDDNDFGPIFINQGERDVVKARGGVRGRVFEVTEIEAPALSPDDVATLIAHVYLVQFAGDFYRDSVDTISLAWPDGTTRTLPYPAMT